MDVDARLQLFDLKKTYQFNTQPGVDRYNMPLYNVQTENTDSTPSSVGMYPVYQGIAGPCYANGYQLQFTTLREQFNLAWPPWIQQNLLVGTGNNTAGPYTFQIPISPNNLTPTNPPLQSLLRGHVDIQGIIAVGSNIDPPVTSVLLTTIPSTSIETGIRFVTQDGTGANMIVTDSGQFLSSNINYGLLMAPGNAPFGNLALSGGYSTSLNTINYLTGKAAFSFPGVVPTGVNIYAQCYYFQCGLPRSMLFYNNTITLRAPPDNAYLISVDAYMTPAAFMTTGDALPFAYMAEYIARGAARKLLADTGDVEQFNFYEPLFKEQELLVWKRSQRQWTSSRTPTIYSQGNQGGWYGYGNQGSNVL